MINCIDRPDLIYPTFTAQYPAFSKIGTKFIQCVDEEDILLHHPYQSFDVVIDFVRQAAADPNVLAIKQTFIALIQNRSW